MSVREKNELKDKRSELKEKIDIFFADNESPDKLVTPADAALAIGVTVRTLWNYRNKMDSYGNDTYELAEDLSFKSLIDELYTRLETKILQWMAQEPKTRTTAAALILNKYFGYRDDGSPRSTNNFNGPTQIKIDVPPEYKKLAQ